MWAEAEAEGEAEGRQEAAADRRTAAVRRGRRSYGKEAKVTDD